jgi:hypothetical protein
MAFSPDTFQSDDRSKNVWQNYNKSPQAQSSTGGSMIVIVKDCFQEVFELESDIEVLRKELSY